MKKILLLTSLIITGCASAQVPPLQPAKPAIIPPATITATVVDTNTTAVKIYRANDGGVWNSAVVLPATNSMAFPWTDTNAARYYTATSLDAFGNESAMSNVGTNANYFTNRPPAAPLLKLGN